MLPRLHVVTDDEVLARDDFTARARDVLAAGDRRVALHLRGPGAPGARLYQLAAELVRASRAAGSLLLVNDRIDVALAADVDGVHLRARSLPPEEARRLLPAGRLVGASVHHEDDARARGPDVDYLVAGTVFASSSHPGRKGGGPALLVRVCAFVRVPVLAIGGITPERVAEVRAAGAYGVAVLSGVWGADEPARGVAGYLERLA